jgi:predicted enzyme related to lactoylglutathione lyase
MCAAVGERTEYAPGTFSWADLSTTDQEGAKRFYQGLFGWEVDDQPVGEGVVYSLMRKGGKRAAAISPQPEQQREAGVPPLWNSYVTVEDADASAERAGGLGATLHSPPFDVMDVGRMAVIQDPQGAFFMIWQPRASFGAEVVNEPGALTWNELSTSDMDAAASFYGDLFGWKLDPFEGSSDPYLVIKNQDRGNGGIRPLDPPGMPPNWLVYFATEEIESGMAKAAELGGTIVAGPVDIGIAKVAVVQDPQGATFALYAGQLEP